jgi:hypothetical protein
MLRDLTPTESQLKEALAARGLLDGDAHRLATGRRLIVLDQVDFAALLALAEPLSATLRRLSEWERDGLIGDAGANLLLRAGGQMAGLVAAITEAGLGDRCTAWLCEDGLVGDAGAWRSRLTDAARCLRDLACDWPQEKLDNVTAHKRMAVAVELLREAIAVKAGGAAPTTGQRRRRRSPPRKPAEPTPGQVEAVRCVGELQNFTAAGRALGKSRQAVTKQFKKGVGKVPGVVRATRKKPMVTPLPTNPRGQVEVADRNAPTRPDTLSRREAESTGENVAG